MAAAVDREVSEARRLYDKFDLFHVRGEPFDEGDMQNIHLWMVSVTRALEELSGHSGLDS